MFIFSIVPIHLSTDSNSVQINTSNLVDTYEHRIMELEGLLSSLILRQYFGTVVYGVDNSDINAVTQELQAARNNLTQLMVTQQDTNSNDSVDRLTEINRMNQWVDTRIADLQALYNSLTTTGQTLSYHVSGVINTDINMIQAELAKVLAYKQVLQTTGEFWNLVSQTQASSGSLGGGTGGSASLEYSDNLELLALSKREIVVLNSFLRSLTPRRSIEEIVAEESSIEYEISGEMQKATTYVDDDSGYTVNSNPSTQAVLSLRANLKGLANEKAVTKMTSGLRDSVSALINYEISYASSIPLLPTFSGF